MADHAPGGGSETWDWPVYALSTAVYAEREDGTILLLERAGDTAMAGQWYLPGGAVERDELPEDGARRELLEETGLEIDGDLELVGAFPMWVYGRDALQLTYRGRVGQGDVVVSHEHAAWRWVDPADMLALLGEDFIAGVAAGDERVEALLRHIRTDLERYLRLRG